MTLDQVAEGRALLLRLLAGARERTTDPASVQGLERLQLEFQVTDEFDLAFIAMGTLAMLADGITPRAEAAANNYVYRPGQLDEGATPYLKAISDALTEDAHARRPRL